MISDWRQGAQPQLLALDRRGRLQRQRSLAGWEVEPGSAMAFDPTRQLLLLTLRNRDGARPVLIDGHSLGLQPQAKSVRLALWLPAG